MSLLNDLLLGYAMISMTVAALFFNLFLIRERTKIKQSFYNNCIMKTIKACELMPGDIFKTNPRLHKEHWADKVVTEDDKVSIDTWARTHLELSPKKEVFLIRSTNPERKQVVNG